MTYYSSLFSSGLRAGSGQRKRSPSSSGTNTPTSENGGGSRPPSSALLQPPTLVIPPSNPTSERSPVRRRRRSSVASSTSPYAAIKSPVRAATQSLTKQLVSSPTRETFSIPSITMTRASGEEERPNPKWRWSSALTMRHPKVTPQPKPAPIGPLPELPVQPVTQPAANPPTLSLINTSPKLMPMVSPPLPPSPLVLGTPMNHPSSHGVTVPRLKLTTTILIPASTLTGKPCSPLSPFTTQSPSGLTPVFKIDLSDPLPSSPYKAMDSYFDVVKDDIQMGY